MKKIHKILIIRFSSIGDIVLTTPVARCLKKKFPDAEIHYLTKAKFASVIDNNPYISKIHVFSDNLAETIKSLKDEKFDFIVDLHHNLRSLRVKLSLRRPSASFPKLNFRKWLYVKTKKNSLMPDMHIVDRYFKTVEKLTVENDHQGLDYFETPEPDFTLPFEKYIAVVCGATYTTKQIPLRKVSEITGNTNLNFVLLGDKKDLQRIENEGLTFGENVFNACGKTTLNQSSILVRNASLVITADTGLMHISAAFGKRIVAVWGNTTPELGMYPYEPQFAEQRFINVENKKLPCRPCSKLGYRKCPKGTMACMDFDAGKVAEIVEKVVGTQSQST